MSDEILINMFMKYGYKYITEDRIKGLLYSIKDVNLKRNVIDKIEELNKIREFKELPNFEEWWKENNDKMIFKTF